MVLRNFLDEKVFFLHVAIVLTCFSFEKSQNKLDLMHSSLLKRFTKLVKMNFKRKQSKNSHASVILKSHFAWIFTKTLFYILSRLSASKLLRKTLKLPRKHAIKRDDFKRSLTYPCRRSIDESRAALRIKHSSEEQTLAYSMSCEIKTP